MNRGKNLSAGSWSRNSGYTIVETLIFLAVSSALFVSAMLLVSGQQGRTEFRNAVKDFELKLTDVANNVSNGYYTNTGNFTCSAPAAGQVIIVAGSNNLGQNSGCIFLGRAFHFGTDNDKQRYTIYSAVGRQFQDNTTDTDVTDLAQAKPLLIAPGITTNVSVPSGVAESANFGSGVTVEKVQYRSGATDYDIGGFGFYSTFLSYGIGGSLNSGSSRVRVVVPQLVLGTVVGQMQGDFVDRFDTVTDANTISNPDGGVRICLNSNGSNQFAWVNLGDSTSGALTTNADFFDGRCP